MSLSLNEQQQNAVDSICGIYNDFITTRHIPSDNIKYGCAALLGGAGTGKSHTVSAIVELLVKDFRIRKVAILAPINIARINLEKFFRFIYIPDVQIDFFTVSSFLGKTLDLDEKGKIIFPTNNPKEREYDVVIVDESSMVGKKDTKELLSTIGRIDTVTTSFLEEFDDDENGEDFIQEDEVFYTASTQKSFLLVIGDEFQHFPINELNCPLIDLVPEKNRSVLTKSMRFSDDSAIGKVINDCRKLVIQSDARADIREYHNQTVKDENGQGFYFFEDDYQAQEIVSAEDKAIRQLTRAWLKAFETNDFYFVRCICFRNGTVRKRNSQVRLALFPDNYGDFLPGDFLVFDKPVTQQKSFKGKTYDVVVASTGELCRVDRLLRVQNDEVKFSDFYETPIKKKRVDLDYCFNYEVYWLNVVFESGRELTVKTLTPEGLAKFEKDLKEFKKDIQEKFVPNGNVRIWSIYKSLMNRYNSLSYAYAMNSHKSQCISVDVSVVDVEDFMSIKFISSKFRGLYVGSSRAKKFLLYF